MRWLEEQIRPCRSGRWTMVMALALVWLIPADALADGESREIPVADTPMEEDDRPGFEETDLSELRRDSFVEQRQFEGVQLEDEAIHRLQRLIENTQQGHPDRAEYIYNLAEKYWQRSRSYFHRAIETQDECYLLEDEGQEEEARRCWFRKEDQELESERLRDDAIQEYARVIREFPDFEHRDTVYFQLGTNFMEQGEDENGLEIFRRLLAEYPNTPYQPQVLLYFGDYYFENEQMFDALDAYQKVVEFDDSPVYQYARYKLGWTYFNIDNNQRALEEFLRVHELASRADEGTAERAMLNQVRNDIVRVYSRIGSPDQALGFFQDLAPEREDWLALMERLALFYGNEAQYQDSNYIYNTLIEVNGDSYKVLDYQYEIVRNTTTISSYSEDALQDIARMILLVQAADEGAFTQDEDEAERLRARVKEASSNWARTYHREAQRTRNENLFVMAHHLYNGYLQTFTEADDRYDMSFFHAELLFELQQWEEAALAYERTLEIDPEGEYTEEIVLATMVSLLEVVDASEERAELDADFEDGEEGEIPEPQELPEEQQRVMTAAKNYMQYAPDGDDIVDVMYIKARTYYDYDHLERAGEIFEIIAFDHSDHDYAEVSANLHLDCLIRLRDYTTLADTVEKYLEKQPVGDPEFQADLREMNMAIRYNICVDLDEEERWEEAAHCYVEYIQDFPDSEQRDMALYNAALDFERIYQIEAAIHMRRMLLEEHPDSEYAPETLYNLGGNFHAWAIYGQASQYYELYVAHFPEEDNAEEALRNAATFRQGLEEYDRAIENYEKYIELFGDDNPEDAAMAFFEIAQIYEAEERDDDAYRQYRDYIRRYGNQGSPDWLLQAHIKIALHYWEQGAREDALDGFDETLAVYGRFSEEEQGSMIDGRDAAAQAKFMLGEDLLEEAEAIRIDSTDDEELREATEEKMEALNKAGEVYEEVLGFGRPDWAIAAVYRVGSGFHDFAETLRESPVPEHLTENQKHHYKALLEDQAVRFEDAAAQYYIQALDAARDANWYNEYTELAETALADIRPAEYRSPSELRAQPDNFTDRFMSASFLEEIDEEDVLEQFRDEDLTEEPQQQEEEEIDDGGGVAGEEAGEGEEADRS